MKKLLLLFVLINSLVFAQVLDPVDWQFSKKKLSDTEIELQFKANIDSNWHLYSQDLPLDVAATATEFTFSSHEGYELMGSVLEEGVIEKYDPLEEQVLKFFEGEAVFIQKIRVLDSDNFKVKGDVYFGVCDDEKCLSPELVEFEFDINSTDFLVDETRKSSEEEGFTWLFFTSILFGLVALLTPCVFPMIPMTVAFFTKHSLTKTQGITNAVIYGISIIVIYVLLGVGVSAIFGADVLNSLATDVYFNIAFFLILIIFGLSFLGAFEIQLPASWTNKSVEGEGKGGLIGIFFMAFTLALVSFSCTGPIVGTLLVQASTGAGYLGPIIGMLGFSLGVALPFTLFAAFPGWLNSLPQSGGWLNSVKVTLGFLEIALAFKFLSTADLVLQTHFLERELFLAIWIIIFGLLTIYLLGFLKLPHDSDLKNVSVTRLSFAIIAGTLTVYMVPGLWGAPLKLVSGLPPPMHYSESPNGVGKSSIGSVDIVKEVQGQKAGPLGILAFHDYEEGLAYAKEVGKPLFLDFTGHGCQNCRKMEDATWSDPEIKNILSNEVVLVSLYCDERTKLPIDQQFKTISAGKKKKIETIGQKWKAFQIERYNSNSQPLYVLLDHNENKLVESANYFQYGTVELFADWLNRGLVKFKQ